MALTIQDFSEKALQQAAKEVAFLGLSDELTGKIVAIMAKTQGYTAALYEYSAGRFDREDVIERQGGRLKGILCDYDLRQFQGDVERIVEGALLYAKAIKEDHGQHIDDLAVSLIDGEPIPKDKLPPPLEKYSPLWDGDEKYQRD